MFFFCRSEEIRAKNERREIGGEFSTRKKNVLMGQVLVHVFALSPIFRRVIDVTEKQNKMLFLELFPH